MDLSSNVVGKIDIPWAVDVRGVKLATSFELLEDSNVVRQHFDASKAVFPVAVDPSWWWWVGTAATCASEVAVLGATGAVFSVKVAAKLVSKINKMKKTKKVANAIKKAGGSRAYAILLAKRTYNKIYSRMPKYVKKVLKSPFKMSGPQLAMADAINLGWVEVADLAGIGHCASLVKAL